MVKQYLQSLTSRCQERLHSPSCDDLKYLQTLPLGSCLPRDLISATGCNCFVSAQRGRQYRNTFFLGHSHLSQEKQEIDSTHPIIVYVIVFPWAWPGLNLHFTISSKIGSNLHKSSFFKPHIQIPGFRNLGKILQSRHWQRCDEGKGMVQTSWSGGESSSIQSWLIYTCTTPLLVGNGPLAH